MCHITPHVIPPLYLLGRKVRFAPGELLAPYAVAIYEEPHQIFVANTANNRADIFYEMGEFFHQLSVGQLSYPLGIATHRDSVYVSCGGGHTVSNFSLTEMCRLRRIGGEGSNNGQFRLPRQLTTDSVGRVFIADSDNERICIHKPDLNHLCNIIHQSTRDRLYVLCPDDNPYLHLLTLEEDKLYSHYLWRRMDVLRPLLFCLDPLRNLSSAITSLTQFVSSLQKAMSYTRYEERNTNKECSISLQE